MLHQQSIIHCQLKEASKGWMLGDVRRCFHTPAERLISMFDANQSSTNALDVNQHVALQMWRSIRMITTLQSCMELIDMFWLCDKEEVTQPRWKRAWAHSPAVAVALTKPNQIAFQSATAAQYLVILCFMSSSSLSESSILLPRNGANANRYCAG